MAGSPTDEPGQPPVTAHGDAARHEHQRPARGRVVADRGLGNAGDIGRRRAYHSDVDPGWSDAARGHHGLAPFSMCQHGQSPRRRDVP
jgi:hypothetical protein